MHSSIKIMKLLSPMKGCHYCHFPWHLKWHNIIIITLKWNSNIKSQMYYMGNVLQKKWLIVQEYIIPVCDLVCSWTLLKQEALSFHWHDLNLGHLDFHDDALPPGLEKMPMTSIQNTLNCRPNSMCYLGYLVVDWN